MPLDSYGVLIGRAVDRRREGAVSTPHYQVRLAEGSGASYRIAINVKSQETPADLLYLLDDDFRHPVTASLVGLEQGWHALQPVAGGANLDFVRGNLFDAADMRPIPPDATGPDNDLADLLDHYVQRAIGDPSALLYAFGARWGPEKAVADKIFGFLPGNGVHDIHMNQGNSGKFRADDGIWQDGGLLIHFPGESRWIGIFLAFQNQAWHTDDVTGHAIDGAEPAAVRIIGAVVNPAGPAPEDEKVLLINASPEKVDLTGWQIADQSKHAVGVPAGELPAGAVLEVHLSDGVQLGNSGGSITLLDRAGIKASGVSYTAQQAQREGWTITF